jgi:hypothetical protein
MKMVVNILKHLCYIVLFVARISIYQSSSINFVDNSSLSPPPLFLSGSVIKMVRGRKKKATSKDEPKTETSKDGKEDEKPLSPADLKFIKMDGDKPTSRASALRIAKGESLEQAIDRLSNDGWNIKDVGYTRQGMVLKAIAQRIKGASRNLRVGTQVKIEYYDIIEAKDQDSISDKIFEKTVEYVGTKNGMLIGKTDSGSFIGFPVSIVANAMPMESLDASESEKSDPSSPTEGDSTLVSS